MTELAVDLEQYEREEVVQPTAVVSAEAGSETVLITEQDVLLGSAAALAGRTVRPTVWARMRAVFAGRQAGGDTRTSRYHPERYGYLERATMSREMWRL